MKDMTLGQARAEAIRRWGARGTIELHLPRSPRERRGRLARYRCIVADGAPGSPRSVEGQGETWREAFADAKPR